ncbi:hypothetical protein MO973_17010 [Paenibacillus sp. TRM 82003]|nr:hypothetical protein [Paenibacillus sp. TRM 82003]
MQLRLAERRAEAARVREVRLLRAQRLAPRAAPRAQGRAVQPGATPLALLRAVLRPRRDAPARSRPAAAQPRP